MYINAIGIEDWKAENMAKEKVGSWDLHGLQHLHTLWSKVRLLVSLSYENPSHYCSPKRQMVNAVGDCDRSKERMGTVLEDWPSGPAPSHLASHNSFRLSDSCLFVATHFGTLCISPWGEIWQGIWMWFGKNRTGLGAKTSNVVLTLSLCNFGKLFWVSF